MNIEAQKVLNRLKDGNRAFVRGESQLNFTKQHRIDLLKGQHPIATIISCSDSRVVPEFIFQQGLGDLFIIRTAGEVLDDIAIGSIEYGVGHLHTPILMVLGHSNCGAVTATATNAEAEGHITDLVKKIQPALNACKECDHSSQNDLINDVIVENTLEIVESLPKESAIIHELVEHGKLFIIGAIYEMETGEVHYLESKESHQKAPSKQKHVW